MKTKEKKTKTKKSVIVSERQSDNPQSVMEAVAEDITLGQKGERIAEKYFMDKGFKILDKNYCKRMGELDLICLKENCIHFVEVKTLKYKYPLPESGPQSLEHQLQPEDKIDALKLRKLVKMAEVYKASRGLEDHDHQIDALAIYVEMHQNTIKRLKVRYIPNISVT